MRYRDARAKIREAAIADEEITDDVVRCLNCSWHLPFAKNLCRACHEYHRRTGRDRPMELIRRHWARQNLANHTRVT